MTWSNANALIDDAKHVQISAFLTLWSEFQAKTSEAMGRVIAKKTGKILWSSRLTNGTTLDALPPDEYKIQFGGDASDTADPQLKTLFDKVGSDMPTYLTIGQTFL